MRFMGGNKYEGYIFYVDDRRGLVVTHDRWDEWHRMIRWLYIGKKMKVLWDEGRYG